MATLAALAVIVLILYLRPEPASREYKYGVLTGAVLTICVFYLVNQWLPTVIYFLFGPIFNPLYGL
jgi:hypothetical protein